MSVYDQTYTTITDVADYYVKPALGEWADDYDMVAIAHAITEYTPNGFVVTHDDDFWDIADKHARED